MRVEALVLFSALIWVLVQLFGSRWRRYSHGFFRFFVWAVHTLFTVLGPYTIGLLGKCILHLLAATPMSDMTREITEGA